MIPQRRSIRTFVTTSATSAQAKTCADENVLLAVGGTRRPSQMTYEPVSPSAPQVETAAKRGAEKTEPELAANLVAVYERGYQKILRLALRITGNLQDAEDAVQECFLQAFTHLDSFCGKSSLSTWISRIAINAALMKVRSRKRGEFSLDEFSDTWCIERSLTAQKDKHRPDQAVLRYELTQLLTKELARLRPTSFKAVQLYYFRELSTRECARVLGVSLATAKARVFHAKRRLRRELDKRFFQQAVLVQFLRGSRS